MLCQQTNSPSLLSIVTQFYSILIKHGKNQKQNTAAFTADKQHQSVTKNSIIRKELMSNLFMCGHRTYQPHPYTQSPKPPETNHLILIRMLLIHGRLMLVNETYYSSFLSVNYGCDCPRMMHIACHFQQSISSVCLQIVVSTPRAKSQCDKA